MKLKVKCDVHSEVILPRRLEFKSNDRVFAFEADARGIWNSLTILADIKDASKVQWGTLDVQGPREPNQAPFNIGGSIEPQLFDSVIAEIQTLESTLSLFMPLRQINWRYPEYEPVFEAGEERSDLGAVRVGRRKVPPKRIQENAFVSIVGIGLKAQSLTVLVSFWREGENDWVAGKFINAFFNYYFVLEGLYGNRETKNKQIKTEMLKSPGLLALIEKFNSGQHPVQHFKQLAAMLNVTTVPTSKELVGLLVSTRGMLHHFQNNPNREQGSPLVHDKYEGIAYLARHLAHRSILELTGRISPSTFVPRPA
jgi:hypothetical protein